MTRLLAEGARVGVGQLKAVIEAQVVLDDARGEQRLSGVQAIRVRERDEAKTVVGKQRDVSKESRKAASMADHLQVCRSDAGLRERARWSYVVSCIRRAQPAHAVPDDRYKGVDSQPQHDGLGCGHLVVR